MVKNICHWEVGPEKSGLQFDAREAEILREVVKFLNDHYATQNFLRYGNQPPPDFNKGRLAPEELKAFWEKLGI